jgi:hypothetical protein
MNRPRPPVLVLDAPPPLFIADPELEKWLRATFLDEGGELANPDHAHLQHGVIGCLWTNVENSRRGRMVVGQCEEGQPSAMQGKWRSGRAEQQLTDWFGLVPDFVLTFDARYCADCEDAAFCALVEHELYHAAQDRDAYGAPKFSKATGKPIFALRGHDVEEFVGVVRRYGAQAAGVAALVEAASQRPTISRASIGHACGTCLALAA